ncbi:MAG: arginase [Myxococcota bacterium]|nr:arginase [Myxococcota bacterium]
MKIAITNVHLDLGAGRRGTDMGPSAIHVAGLVPKIKGLGHSISSIYSIGSPAYEALDIENKHSRFLSPIFKTCEKLHQRVYKNVSNGAFPLVLGGDHSQAIGTISGISKHYKQKKQDIGVIWIDAHTDMNTPSTSPTGNIHGMPLSCLLGHGHERLLELNGEEAALKPENVAIIGVRDVDMSEIPLVKELGVRVYTMTEIDRRGAFNCFYEAIERVSKNTVGVHLSFDLDGVDPIHAPGVGTPVPGGLNFRESHLICEMLTSRLIGMEMVELNPTLDVQNKTGQLAVWLILSALGKRIIG